MNGVTDLSLAAAFAAGISSSMHCIAMCGGLASAFGMRARVVGHSAPAAFVHASAYQVGRLTSYSMAGALCGAFGALAQDMLDLVGLAMWLRVLAGVLLMLLGLQVLFGWHLLRPLESLGAQAWRKIAPLAMHSPRQGLGQALFIGALWGWLPCGLVYSMLLLGALGGGAAHGASVMLAFGAGTLPAMLSSALLSSQLTRFSLPAATQKKLKWLAGGLMLVFGIWTAWVAFAHMSTHSVHHH